MKYCTQTKCLLYFAIMFCFYFLFLLSTSLSLLFWQTGEHKREPVKKFYCIDDLFLGVIPRYTVTRGLCVSSLMYLYTISLVVPVLCQ